MADQLDKLVLEAIPKAFRRAAAKFGRLPEDVHLSAVTDEITSPHAYDFGLDSPDEKVEEALRRLQNSSYRMYGTQVRLTDSGRKEMQNLI